jgi:hypothetical protein
MKLAVSALVLSFAAFSARGDSALRGGSSSDTANLASDTGYNGLTLFLDHVKTGAVASDDVVIGAIVDSYNKVHDTYSIKSAFKNEEIAVPEEGTDGAYYDSMGRFTIGWGTSSSHGRACLFLCTCIADRHASHMSVSDCRCVDVHIPSEQNAALAPVRCPNCVLKVVR